MQVLYTFTFLLSLFASGVSLIIPVQEKRSTPGDIQAMITNLTSQATNTYEQLVLAATSNISLVQALKVHTAFTTLDSTVSGDIMALTLLSPTVPVISEEDGQVIVTQSNGQLTPILQDIQVFMAKSGNKINSVVAPLIKQDFGTLFSNLGQFFEIWRELLPADLKDKLFGIPPIVIIGPPVNN